MKTRLTPQFAFSAKRYGSQEQPLQESWQSFDEIQQLDPPAPAQTLEPPQQQTDPQQQPPQQQQQPADPFAGIDMDMLDDETRKSVETARAQFATIAKERDQISNQLQHTEAQRREFQSQIDRVNSQLQQSQRASQPPKEPTMAEALAQYYQDNANLPPEQAKRAAETMSGVFQIFGKQFEQNIGRQFAPIANASLQNTATQVFADVRDTDPTGAMQNPQIAQKVWDSVSRLMESGQIPDVELVNNIKRIHMASAIEDGSWQFQQQPQQPATAPYPASIPGFQMPRPNMQNPFPTPQPANPSTRFTFPGANPGNIRANGSPPPGVRGGGGSPLDPETAAAVAATTGQWRKTKK